MIFLPVKIFEKEEFPKINQRPRTVIWQSREATNSSIIYEKQSLEKNDTGNY